MFALGCKSTAKQFFCIKIKFIYSIMAIKYFVYNGGKNFEASLILSYLIGGFQYFNDLWSLDMIHTSSLHLCLQTFE